MNNEIILKDIWFSYGNGKDILRGLNFNFKKGEKAIITGKNGSGKTTLFRILMGLEKVKKGEISIFGEKREKEEDFVEVRKKIGCVFQDIDSRLFAPTVEEEIAFGMLNQGIKKEETVKRVEEILTYFNLNYLKGRVPFHLSGGEKRIIGFCSVVLMQSEIFLFDEITEELDDEKYKKVVDYLNNKINSYILITQDKNLFSLLKYDKLYELKDGKMISQPSRFPGKVGS